MATIDIKAEVDLDAPTCIEGLPGIGLVGKIAGDHIIDTFDMTYYAAVRCSGLPPVAIYHDEEPELKPPVRLYADAERDLLVLHSDIPIAADSREAFAGCVVEWCVTNDVTPVFLSGLPQERKLEQVGSNDDNPETREQDGPKLFGVATGDGNAHLTDAGIDPPNQSGAMSGPTGALLHEALDRGLTSVGLVVEANPQFPDPEASKALLDHAIVPITGLSIDTESLIEQAEEIRMARERLAKRMQQAEAGESSQAQPLRGFQ